VRLQEKALRRRRGLAIRGRPSPLPLSHPGEGFPAVQFIARIKVVRDRARRGRRWRERSWREDRGWRLYGKSAALAV